MDNEMIERCARAILKDAGILENKDNLRIAARYTLVVIKAMREPTEQMLRSEGVYTNCNTCGGHEEGWKKIIDALIGDK